MDEPLVVTHSIDSVVFITVIRVELMLFITFVIVALRIDAMMLCNLNYCMIVLKQKNQQLCSTLIGKS